MGAAGAMSAGSTVRRVFANMAMPAAAGAAAAAEPRSSGVTQRVRFEKQSGTAGCAGCGEDDEEDEDEDEEAEA